ncbi:MAG: DNA polymerase III subunit psi [Wenzhouxiangellaceae bacterium]|nr:DNA polymerase III subunit psi [Wenzhouxiangellaceae bacterium]
MPDRTSLRRLEAMDIPVWVLRGRQQPAEAGASALPRVRLEAGDGDWLLVADGAARSDHAMLLDDIRAAIGTARCRFGQWSDSPESGVSPDDWAAHGIEHVLAFGESAPRADGLISSPSLAELAGSARARRELWQQLAPRLGG